MKTVGIYEMIREIGQGSYGNVYEARRSGSNEPLAIKMISTAHLEQKQIDLVQMEVQVLQKIDYPSIIKLLDVRRTKNNYYLVFEFCEKGDLEKYLKKHSEIPLNQEIVQKLIYHVSDAVRVLHNMNIVHRDIKLANILLTKDFAVKLSDFGFAKTANTGMLMETYCGTPMNMAPEILLRHQYSLKCDIWSLGVVLFQLAYGKLPFSPGKGKGLIDLIEIIQDFKEVSFPSHPILPQSFKDLIRSSLRKDPEKRIDIEEFFNNEWVQAGKNTMINTSNLLKTISVSSEVELQQESEATGIDFELNNDTSPEEGGSSQNPLQINIGEKSVSRRIHSSIQEQIEAIEDSFLEIFKPENRLSLKQEMFRDLIQFLYFSYIKNIRDTPVRVLCREEEFQFSISDIPSLATKLPLPPKSQSTYSLNSLIQLLSAIADNQKIASKEESLRDYRIMVSLFDLLKREATSIEISGEVEELRLKNVRKCLVEGGYGGERKNGVILHTKNVAKNLEFSLSVKQLKKLCEERVADVESEIANKN